VNPQSPGRYTKLEWDLGLAHAAFASVMFLALAYFCLVLFRKSAPGRKPTRAKLRRNKLYTVCGVVIMLCNVVMASQLAPSVYRILMPYYPLFCSETLALAAFGVAWLTKGNGIMKDRPPKQPEL
jgi:amino acid transporter